MRRMKLNKKGFTLVELLAVIVILALLIVITANTVLPMMNKSKKNGMATYAGRVINTASSEFQADSLSAGSGTAKAYSIEDIMGESTYVGCVEVDPPSDGSEDYTYKLNMYNPNDKLAMEEDNITEVTFSADNVSDGKDYKGPASADEENDKYSGSALSECKKYSEMSGGA